MIIELKSKYLSINSTKDGDVVEITSEGVLEPQKSKFTDTTEDILVLSVLHNGNKSTFSLYEKYKKPFLDAWGPETRNWIDKKFQILHINDKMEVRPILPEQTNR